MILIILIEVWAESRVFREGHDALRENRFVAEIRKVPVLGVGHDFRQYSYSTGL